MEAEVRFESAAAIAVFADEGAGPEVRTRDVAKAEALRGRAKAGGVFLAETEDPSISNLRIYLDEPVPPEIEETCSSRSGSFLLRVPSGRLRVVAGSVFGQLSARALLRRGV